MFVYDISDIFIHLNKLVPKVMNVISYIMKTINIHSDSNMILIISEMWENHF